jgi:hypothetical protein
MKVYAMFPAPPRSEGLVSNRMAIADTKNMRGNTSIKNGAISAHRLMVNDSPRNICIPREVRRTMATIVERTAKFPRALPRV